MIWKTIRAAGHVTAASLVIAAGVGCGRSVSPAGPLAATGANPPPAVVRASASASDFRELRAATARFHDIDQAAAAGWNTAVTPCMTSPAGGQGIHFGNLLLIDGGVNLLMPELLMYEPRGNGTLHLVGVEYIVPFGLWTAASPPSLFGETFHRNEAAGLWVLHVWIWKPNPAGMHADWNPNVSCG